VEYNLALCLIFEKQFFEKGKKCQIGNKKWNWKGKIRQIDTLNQNQPIREVRMILIEDWASSLESIL